MLPVTVSSCGWWVAFWRSQSAIHKLDVARSGLEIQKNFLKRHLPSVAGKASYVYILHIVKVKTVFPHVVG